MTVQLKIKRLHPQAVLPRYATDGAACFDLCAMIALSDLPHGHMMPALGAPVVVRTGLSFEVPPGHVMLVFSRSGQGFNADVRLANAVGVIDADYRGEVLVKLTRDPSAAEPLVIRHGDRIAQAMIVPLPAVAMVEVDELGATARGAGGFGSTGA